MRVAKIKKAILDKGMCFEEIACELGLSSKTLERKLKENTIGIVEAEYIAEKLSIDNPAEIFFG